MIGGRMSHGVFGTCATLLVLVQAGPLLRFPRESEDYPNSDFSNYTANEVCFSDQKVFQRGEEVPNAGPCEECRCEPPSIVCQMLKCPVNNNGCRTIQRPNHCCPDYNCECDYNGQLYNDGERIDLPEDPCQVCYCKGGDVMCTSITCYQRDDCEPKHVPGQCCPKYEDCPIRDMEASNTEDKNVQTRSPNKTMNSNPKKEMQPWLLTKSVPQTSSSLAIPKLGETTTDSGNVIVSDWLVERKTTEDFNTKQTEDPDLSTHREFITTIQPQKPTQLVEKESSFDRNLQTVKPTPVDEVVFTRIDIPKRIQDEIHDSLTTTASITLQNSTLYDLKLPEVIKDLKLPSENTITNLSANSSYEHLDEKSIDAKKTDDNSSSSTPTIQPEKEIITTMSSIELIDEDILSQTSAITKIAPIKVQQAKENDAIETSTPECCEIEITENPSNHTENKAIQQTNESTQNETVTKSPEDFQSHTNLSQGLIVLDGKDKSSGEMTLEQLFGFDKLNENESIKQISTEKYNPSNTNIFLSEETTNVYSTFPTKTENRLVNDDGSKSSSLNNNPTTETITLGEINVAKNGSTKGKNSSHLYEQLATTEIPYVEQETTTSFNSKLNINKLTLHSDKFEHESNENNEETYLPETTTEIETSTLLAVTIPKQLNAEEKENVLNNLIEGKEEDNTGYTNSIDTTTSSNTERSGYTDSLTSLSKKPSSTEEIQLNTKSMLNDTNFKHNMQQASHSYISMVNAFPDSTSKPDYKEEETENSLSEIEIVLGETNNTNVLDKSISSQESDEHDEVVLDLAFDEVSNENKEIIHANHPPVLELNSHVPFLQIGGDGNSESSGIEYDQTTLVNNIDVVDNFDVHGKKEIIKHIQNEEIPNSSTVTAFSSTKEPGNAKVEEFTIPTIAVVPLTPGDLKMIAEYLISEKIKPVSSKNNSMFSPNQWLKGNLTSEENIASILSAANISIGLMNETNIGRKLETYNKTNQSVRLEKFDKDTRHKSNSILDNKNAIISKIDYLHDKNSDNQEIFKTTTHSHEEVNSRISGEHFSTEAISNTFRTTTTMPISKGNSRSEQVVEDIQKIKSDVTSTEMINTVSIPKPKSDASLKSETDFVRTATNNTDYNKINDQTTKEFIESEQNETTTTDHINQNLESVNVHKTDNLLTKDKITSKSPVSDDDFSDSSTTIKTDNKVINEPTTRLFSGNKQTKTVVEDKIDKNLENLKVHNTDDNLVTTVEKNINLGTTRKISRLSVSEEKPSVSSTTNKHGTTASNIVNNKPSHEEISS